MNNNTNNKRLIGLILIIYGIISFGFGPIGIKMQEILKALFGIVWVIVPIALLIIGICLIIDINNILKLFGKNNLIQTNETLLEHEEITIQEEIKQDNISKENKIVINSVEDLKSNSKIKKEEEKPVVNNDYLLPDINQVFKPNVNKNSEFTENIKDNKNKIEKILKDYKISGKVIDTNIGPVITEYEIEITNGTKIDKIKNIKDELCLAFGTKEIKIQIPIPGKNNVGIDVPNPVVSIVTLKEVIEDKQFLDNDKRICIALGKDKIGNSKFIDLTKTPNLLIVGTTGSGKSTLNHSIICSILMKYRPDEVKLVLVDTKMVEFPNYNGIPHLLCPVVTDPKKANLVLQKVVSEMDRRYKVLIEKGVKNINDYNEIAEKENISKMNYIVVIVDDISDLMLISKNEVENSITRIAELARITGIHIIISTQNFYSNVITEVIKEKIPSRIAFRVANSAYSKKIIDCVGAEKLRSDGDMYYLSPTEKELIRLQCCFISNDEIDNIVNFIIKQQPVSYNENFSITPNLKISNPASIDNTNEDDDPIYDEVVKYAIETGKISASLIQRRFRLGYNRAAHLVDLLEDRGIIGPQNGSKPREVLIKLKEK